MDVDCSDITYDTPPSQTILTAVEKAKERLNATEGFLWKFHTWALVFNVFYTMMRKSKVKGHQEFLWKFSACPQPKFLCEDATTCLEEAQVSERNMQEERYENFLCLGERPISWSTYCQSIFYFVRIVSTGLSSRHKEWEDPPLSVREQFPWKALYTFSYNFIIFVSRSVMVSPTVRR